MADDAPKSFRETIDSARDQVLTTARKSFDGVKESVKTANPYLGEKLEQTEGAVTKLTTEFEEKGFCTNYKNFNIELFRPFMRADAAKPLLAEIQSTLTLKPENPTMAFVMWNVLCFWLGVFDFMFLFLVSSGVVAGELVIAAADGFTGYCFAYYFYFVFVCTENKKWKLTGFVALVFYVLIVIYLAYAAATTLNIPELVLNVLKAIFNTIVGYHAYLLYKGAPSAEML